MNVDTLAAARLAEEALALANRAYHGGDEPVMIDADYDALKAALRAAYVDHPEWAPQTGALDVVGVAPSSGARTARHMRPMLSLANAMDAEDAADFFRSVEGAVLHGEWKLDGLSLSLRYEYGALVRAATRGDGETGEDVTHRMARVDGVPARLTDTFLSREPLVEVRGEVCMRRATFARLNVVLGNEGRPLLSNPRNAAAGSLRRDDAHPEGRLDFYAYQVVGPDGPMFPSQSEALAACRASGFSVSPETRLFSGLDDALAWYEDVGRRRGELPVDIDGLVYKVNDQEQAARFGASSTAPRWAVAHKFPPDKVWTRLLAIDLQVGRTGVLAPVARLEPVMVGGVVVSNATLHNRAYIAGRDGNGAPIRNGNDVRVGDRVEVFRAGDVIPRVGAVDVGVRAVDSVAFAFPDACPSCGGPVEHGALESRCPNRLGCAPQRLAAFVHACARDALDADGVSESALSEWLSWGWVSRLADLFTLERRHGPGSPDPLEARLGWGRVSAAAAFETLHKARTATADRVLFALGVPLVGKTTARDLMARFKDLEALRDAACAGGAELLEVPGVGGKVAEALRVFWCDPNTRADAEALMAELSITNPRLRLQTEAGPLAGWSLVFTGALPGQDREAAAEEARGFGAAVSGAVSKKTTALVAGDGGGSKRVKAEALGVPVLDASAWARLRDAALQGLVPTKP